MVFIYGPLASTMLSKRMVKVPAVDESYSYTVGQDAEQVKKVPW